jgi:hypothetical protein
MTLQRTFLQDDQLPTDEDPPEFDAQLQATALIGQLDQMEAAEQESFTRHCQVAEGEAGRYGMRPNVTRLALVRVFFPVVVAAHSVDIAVGCDHVSDAGQPTN